MASRDRKMNLAWLTNDKASAYRSLETDFSKRDPSLDQINSRLEFIASVKSWLKPQIGLKAWDLSYSEVHQKIDFAIRSLPTSDINILDEVIHGWRMFEKLKSQSSSASDFYVKVLSELHDVAVLRAGEGLKWNDFVSDCIRELEAKQIEVNQRQSEICEQWKKWGLEQLPLIMAACWCVVLAITDFDSLWPYQLSRWALCLVAVYSCIKIDGWRQFLPIALIVVFNPLAPITFSENQWQIVDWVAFCAFGVIALFESPWSIRYKSQ